LVSVRRIAFLTAAVLFGLTTTCHRLSAEPWAYRKDVSTTPAGQLGDHWQAARSIYPADNQMIALFQELRPGWGIEEPSTGPGENASSDI
jgi:hypothetical protein